MPVEYPRNSFTEMIEMAGRMRAAQGQGGGFASGEPRPSVQTPAMRNPQPIAPVEEPLSASEVMELNRLAIEAGVKDERLGSVDAPDGGTQYPSMEAAIAAGAPVRVPSVGPVELLDEQPAARIDVRQPNLIRPPGPARVVVQQQPRLPNFQNVQGIDLLRGVAFVDDMEFPILPAEVVEFRKFVMEIARESIMKKLEEAISQLTAETPEATDGSEVEP